MTSYDAKDPAHISIVIPCSNEQAGIGDTLDELLEVLNANIETQAAEVMVVNDASTDETPRILERYITKWKRFKVVTNQVNLGYGASLKRGILEAKGEIIVITDGDGTYPASAIPELLEKLADYDMTVGARIGRKVNVPLVRRPAKWTLLRYARWMARADIKDLNSGLRAFRKKDALRFFPLLPEGFSFTSTITIGMHVNNLRVHYIPIDYRKRAGKSSIRPIRDTLAFFSLVLRTTMYFRPLQVFGVLSGILILLAFAAGILGKIYTGEVPDVSTVSLLCTGLIFFGLGLVGDLINASRNMTTK